MKTPRPTSNFVTLAPGRIQSRINRPTESEHLARVGENVERAIDLDLDFVSTADLSLLPALAHEGEVDFFIHDPGHAYLNMGAEFGIIRKPGSAG